MSMISSLRDTATTAVAAYNEALTAVLRTTDPSGEAKAVLLRAYDAAMAARAAYDAAVATGEDAP